MVAGPTQSPLVHAIAIAINAALGNIGQTGLGEAGKLSSGIALILRATLWGLLIAIPSLISWSYFSKKIEIMAVEMETLCDEFIRRQYRDQGNLTEISR